MGWKLETVKRLKADAATAGWWDYDQNNTGGSFDGGMGYKTFVWAENGRAADAIAENNGIYFDGCDTGQDCSCCGDRWSRSWGDKPDYPDIPVADLVAELTKDALPPGVRGGMFAGSTLDAAARWGLGIRIIDKDGNTHWLRKDDAQ